MGTRKLIAVEVQVEDGHLMIPQGMTPIFAHRLEGRMIAHVEGWTAEKEYDQQDFNLYPLSEADSYILQNTSEGETVEQEWFIAFGAPTKQAIRRSGELVIRQRVG